MSALSTYGKTTQKEIVVENTINFQVTDALECKLVAANPSSGGFQYNLPALSASVNLLTDAAGGIAITALDINGGTTASMSDSDKLVFYDAATTSNKVMDGTALKAYIGAGDTLPSASDNQIMVSSGADNYVSVTASGALSNTAGAFALANNYVTDAMINGSAAISKSKLAALDIGNADVAAGAAIAKSKLANLDVGNADVAANAAIDYSKLQLNNAIVNGDLQSAPSSAGTVQASKFVLVDASSDVSGFGNVTMTGSVQAADVLVGSSQWKVVNSGSDLAFQHWSGSAWVTKHTISSA